jgi:hypothetical protein
VELVLFGRRRVDDQAVAGPAGLGMQLTEDTLEPVVALRLGPVQHVGLEQVAQPRPVWRDQQLPALLQQVGERGPGCQRVIQKPPGCLGGRLPGPLD